MGILYIYREVLALLTEPVPPLWLVTLRVRILYFLLRLLRRLVTLAKVIYIYIYMIYIYTYFLHIS